MPFELTHLLVIGLAAGGIALWAWLADRRRIRRSDPDAVGWVPWRGVSLWSTVVAVIAFGLAARAWLAG